jgi:uncharacterized FlaG/YvyC family protein
VSDIRAIGESEGHKRGQGQLLGTLRTAQDSREIRQNPTNNEHDHRNIEHFSSDSKTLKREMRVKEQSTRIQRFLLAFNTNVHYCILSTIGSFLLL